MKGNWAVSFVGWKSIGILLNKNKWENLNILLITPVFPQSSYYKTVKLGDFECKILFL